MCLQILCNERDVNQIKEAFNETLNSIDKWAQYSGATISIEKYKHLHVCRKTSCSNVNINYKNSTLIM